MESKVTHSLVTALRAVPGFATVDEGMLAHFYAAFQPGACALFHDVK